MTNKKQALDQTQDETTISIYLFIITLWHPVNMDSSGTKSSHQEVENRLKPCV